MERLELVHHLRETLTRAGFYVSDLCSIRLPGFDLVARRDSSLLIIKVLTNIDALSEHVSDELKTLASLLGGTPLLIGEKKGLTPLEDDVVYLRFGISSLTLNTFRDHLLEGIPIRAYAGPGGFYVRLDEEKLQQLRREQNISLGTFARQVHVSRKTAQLYEKGMNARVEVADRIEEFFDSCLTMPIELFSQIPAAALAKSREIRREQLQELQQEIFSLLEHVGYRIIPMDRCPFEAVSKDRKQILLTCVQPIDKKLEQKAQMISSISKITEKHAAVFTDKDTTKTNIHGTALIKKKELKKLHGPEEVFELIIERVDID